MSTEFWGKLITIVVLALVSEFVPVVITWVKVKWEKAKADLKAAKPDLYETLATGAKLAVNAAEQAGAAQVITDKKSYAISAVQGYLDAHGWSGIDIAVIDAAVENAVKEAAFPHTTSSTDVTTQVAATAQAAS